MEKFLPIIPAKRYFTIGEVSELCGVKPHVLRYWEQEFTQLHPMKRRGNRRYYQHHEVLMIRKIRELLYDQGFTISGARNKLHDLASNDEASPNDGDIVPDGLEVIEGANSNSIMFSDSADFVDSTPVVLATEAAPDTLAQQKLQLIRRELFEIRELLGSGY